CTASCDETTEERSTPASSTAAAESSHELSIPRTTTGASGRPLAARRLDGEEDRVVAAADEEEDALSLAGRLERLAVGVDVLHRRPVHLEDDVAAAEPGVGGRAARIDLCHHDALEAAVEAEVLGHLGREGLHREAHVLRGAGARLRRLLLLQLGDLDAEGLLGLVADDLQLDGLADGRARDQE